MTERLNKIFNVLTECEVFADIGCDHGYIAKAMLDSNKCKTAIISDISEKCLSKAEKLLSKYISVDRVKSVVSDGFENLSRCNQALIAGMGGEEIVNIIKRAREQNKLPERLVVQPMKNCDKVRLCAVKAGYKIDYDQVFYSGEKYYNLIVLSFGEDCLTDEEIEFGRDNVRLLPPDFKKMILYTIEKLRAFSENGEVAEKNKDELNKKIEKLKKYV